MLIVSKFHDYYDVGMKLGIDKTVVYERITNAIEGTFPNIEKYRKDGDWSAGVLAFCGEFYPFVYLIVDQKIADIIWDVEEAVNILPKSKWKYWDLDRLDSEPGIRKFFARQYPELEKLYHTYRSPIFGFTLRLGRSYSWSKKEDYTSLVINPNLKDIEFYRIKDPITAFQEVYMFMSGVIGAPPKPKEKISDEIMAASKGHDSPYSFRKPPGKRGKKQWR